MHCFDASRRPYHGNIYLSVKHFELDEKKLNSAQDIYRTKCGQIFTNLDSSPHVKYGQAHMSIFSFWLFIRNF